MKISSQDEYGLRIMIRIAKDQSEEGLSIPQLSEMEGLSSSYVAKLTRTLRMANLIQSTRGHKGGYVLSKKADEIKVKEILTALGGMLFDQTEFCGNHAGNMSLCTNSVDCSVRSLWKIIQATLDQVLDKITLQDLLGSEKMVAFSLHKMLEEQIKQPS